MASSFLEKMENSYTIPSSICISSGNEPTDIRQTCETVDDFQEIADMGMELRYAGLVTYEIKTGLWKGCKIVNGKFEWETISGGASGSVDLSEYAKKDHKHIEYLPEMSEIKPSEERPKGHVWLEAQ